MKITEFERDKFGRIIIIEDQHNIEHIPNDCDRIKFYFGDETRYFFKAENEVTDAFSEVFASAIAQKVGLNTVKYYPAVFVDYTGFEFEGVVCEDYTQNNTSLRLKSKYLFSICNVKNKNTIENHIYMLGKAVDVLQSQSKAPIIVDLRRVKNELYNLLAFDTLTLQRDRGLRNIEYLLVNKGVCWQLELAPIFDNSMMMHFGILRAEQDLIDCVKKNEPLPKDYLYRREFLFGTNQGSRFCDIVSVLQNQYIINPQMRNLLDNFAKLDIDEVYKQILIENSNYSTEEINLDIVKAVLKNTVSNVRKEYCNKRNNVEFEKLFS